MAKGATKSSEKKTAVKKTVKKRAPQRRKVNKSAEIRAYRLANPGDGPTAISEALAKKGIKVSPPQVSNVLSNAAKKDGTSPRRGKIGGADKVSVASLLEAQQFADKVGGVASARQLLGALEKLNR